MGYMVVAEPSGIIRKVQTERFELEDFQKEVGGWIGTTMTRIPNVIAVVDDEGLLKGYTPNLTASLIANNMLVGNVVFGKTKGADIIPFEDEFEFENLIERIFD